MHEELSVPPLREVNPISVGASVCHSRQVEVVSADASNVGIGGPMVEQKGRAKSLLCQLLFLFVKLIFQWCVGDNVHSQNSWHQGS